MTLHLYFARRFAMTFLGVFMVFAMLQGLLDLIEELRNLGQGAGLRDALYLTFLRLPEALYGIMPLVMILASIAMFLALARSSELVVARAAGRSGLAILAGPALVALLFGGAIVAVMNPVVAATSRQYVALSEMYETGTRSVISIGREGLWLRQGGEDGQAVIRAARANADASVLYDVSIVTYHPDGGPRTRFEARQALLEDGAWHLRQVKSWPLTPGLNPEAGALTHATYRLPSPLTQGGIRDRFGKPNSVAIWDLPLFIAGLEEAGFSARRHLVWMHGELARPLFLVAMLLIGAGFTMRPARLGRTGLAVLTAVLLGFGLYYVRDFAQILGESGQISPALAAWVPPCASVLLALGLVLHMEDG